MDPSKPRLNIKHIAGSTAKAQGKRAMLSDTRPPPPPKRPQFVSSSVSQQASQFRNDLQRSRYDLLQGTKYSCGKQVDWKAFVHANFYAEVYKYLVNMS